MARKKDYAWRHYLPRAKSERGWRGPKGGSSAAFIPLCQPLTQRPQAAADRRTPGHWEADLMLFGNRGQSLLTLVERHSRLLLALPLTSKTATPVASAITQLLAPFPDQWRQTVSFDNGTEFTRHHQLHALGIQTFFCDTRSPWQKVSVENGIGRLRRFLPRQTNLAQLPEDRIAQLLLAYNNTPRKYRGYQTPAEILFGQVLHLKCESTFLLSQERRGEGAGV